MRIILALLAAAAAAFATSALAQQSDWNHPSFQQQEETKDFSQNVKDGLDNIGSAEQSGPGQTNYTNPSSSDQEQIHGQVQDAVKQGGALLDNLPQFPGR